MSHGPSLLRAFGWLAIGILADLALILYILFTSSIFKEGQQPSGVPHHRLGDPEVLVFLAVTLMSGAAADYVLSIHGKKNLKGWIIALLLLVIFIACILFHPKEKPEDTYLWWFKISYCIVGGLFCLWAKAGLFYEEKLKKDRPLIKSKWGT